MTCVPPEMLVDTLRPYCATEPINYRQIWADNPVSFHEFTGYGPGADLTLAGPERNQKIGYFGALNRLSGDIESGGSVLWSNFVWTGRRWNQRTASMPLT